MSVPDYQSIMRPLLEHAGDGQEHLFREAVESLAARFGLTEEERQTLLPSGRQRVFNNRVGWACTYLKKAGILESQKRAHFNITDRGRQVLAENASELNSQFLKKFEDFREFQAVRDRSDDVAMTPDLESRDTPEETMDVAYQSLRAELAAEILESIQDCSPAFFEKLVVELLVAMGYGGSLKDAGEAIGRSGDEGIDGIIKEDRLGLDVVYVQAKRWKLDATIGRPEIQKFAGALQGHRARKGVFIATCPFTREAKEYVSRIETKIVLIDGTLLTQLMMDSGVGVTPVTTYHLHKLDADYFSED